MTLDLMHASPLDRAQAHEITEAPDGATLVASRFNARLVDDDGRLIIWNTLAGTMNMFQAHETDIVVSRIARGRSEPVRNKADAYLLRRGYLVPAGTDEMQTFRYRYGQEQHRSDALEFILLASEDCNFRCKYCYEQFKRGTMRPEVRQGIRALVLQRAPKLTRLNVRWFGGEPLYGWEAMRELVPFFADVATHHGLMFTSHITTNGYLLTPERADLLLAHGVNDYQITLDGLAAQHDCKRVGRDGSPTFAVIMDNLRALRERPTPFHVSLRVNVDKENYPHLDEFLTEIGKDFGTDPRFTVHFHAVGQWGGPNDEALEICNDSEMRQVMRHLNEQTEAVGVESDAGITHQFGAQVCYAARPYNYLIGATGKIMKCTIALDTLDANVVGQIMPDGRLVLDDAKLGRWVAPGFETDSQCQSCYLVPTCQGNACPLTRITAGERTCCGTKSALKSEMRYTLRRAVRRSVARA